MLSLPLLTKWEQSDLALLTNTLLAKVLVAWQRALASTPIALSLLTATPNHPRALISQAVRPRGWQPCTESVA